MCLLFMNLCGVLHQNLLIFNHVQGYIISKIRVEVLTSLLEHCQWCPLDLLQRSVFFKNPVSDSLKLIVIGIAWDLIHFLFTVVELHYNMHSKQWTASGCCLDIPDLCHSNLPILQTIKLLYIWISFQQIYESSILLT